MSVIKAPNASADEVLNTLLISSDLSPLILTAIISGVTSFVPIPQMKKLSAER